MKKPYDRLAGESDKSYSAFKLYLFKRNYADIAKTLQVTDSHIRNLAAKFDWRERADSYDAEILSQAAAQMKAELAEKLLGQWQATTKLQDSALTALLDKDLSRCSYRSLNEIFHSAAQLQLKLVDLLGLLQPKTNDSNNLEIRIIPVTPSKVPVSSTAE